MKPDTQEHYIILQTVYYKTPKLYAAIKQEQSCDMHPALFDTPMLRKLDRQERQVWLLLDGRRTASDIAALLHVTLEHVELILQFLEDDKLIVSSITSKPVQPLFSSWPYADWLTRLQLSSSSFWRFVCAGFSLYPYLRSA